MTAPMLAVGDGNIGLWAALLEVYPETKEERCWKDKLANVLDSRSSQLSASSTTGYLENRIYGTGSNRATERYKRIRSELRIAPFAIIPTGRNKKTLASGEAPTRLHWVKNATVRTPCQGVKEALSTPQAP